MKAAYTDPLCTLYEGNFLDNDLPDESVQMVVTSPPYWGLRKYSGEQDLVWGGDKLCSHEWGNLIPRAGYRSNDNNPGKLQSIATQNRNIGGSNFCSLCGAWRGSYGLEPTPEMYVQHTIEIFEEVKRVLRRDGVAFVNCGDSYFAGNVKTYGTSYKRPQDLKQNGQPSVYQDGEYQVASSDRTSDKGPELTPELSFDLHDPIPGHKVSQPGHFGTLGCEYRKQILQFAYAIRGQQHSPNHEAEQLLASQESSEPVSSLVFPRCPLALTCSDSLSSVLPSLVSIPQSEDMMVCPFAYQIASGAFQENVVSEHSNHDNALTGDSLASHIQGKGDEVSVSYPYYNIPYRLKAKDLCLIPQRLAIAFQNAGWWVRSVIIWNKPSTMPESVKDRPTDSHEYILMLVKGQSSVTTIKFSQLNNKATELSDNRLFKKSRVRDITRLCVTIATSILNSPYFQEDLCLLLLNPQIREEYSQAISSGLVGDLPSKQLVLSNVARFLHGDITAETFLKEFYSSIVNLSNSDIFLIGGGLPFMSDTPSIYSDGKGTITVQNTGEICKFDFIHNLIIAQKPTTCNYYWDAEAVKTKTKGNEHDKRARVARKRFPTDMINGIRAEGYYPTANIRSVWTAPSQVWQLRADLPDSGRAFVFGELLKSDLLKYFEPIPNTDPMSSVQTFPTQPSKLPHYAIYPEKLPDICIKAATPEAGCCSKCGKPWVRVIKVVGKQVTESMRVAGCKVDGTYTGQDLSNYAEAMAQSPSDTKRRILESMGQIKKTAWRPDCKCEADKVPSVVLDPFAGSGTTLSVAKRLGRQSIGYEISSEYCRLAAKRIEAITAPLELIERLK